MATSFKTEFSTSRDNGDTLTVFSDSNKATNLQVETDPSNFFCSYLEVGKIFRHLLNKTSYGLDEIPPIVLEHLPSNVILAYTILFNNALNNYYFPKSWNAPKFSSSSKKGKTLITLLATVLSASHTALAKSLKLLLTHASSTSVKLIRLYPTINLASNINTQRRTQYINY